MYSIQINITTFICLPNISKEKKLVISPTLGEDFVRVPYHTTHRHKQTKYIYTYIQKSNTFLNYLYSYQYNMVCILNVLVKKRRKEHLATKYIHIYNIYNGTRYIASLVYKYTYIICL